MIRNLVSRLPKLVSNNNSLLSIRNRTEVHSLSPYRKPSINIPLNARSSSCSRTENTASFHNSRGAIFKDVIDMYKEDSQWHETSKSSKSNKNKKINKSTSHSLEIEGEKSNTLKESVEQYELEAARPRSRNQDLIRQFRKINSSAKFSHLQPDKIKPFGSQEYPYAPILMKPAIPIKNPNDTLEYIEEDNQLKDNSELTDSEFYEYPIERSTQKRKYSTNVLNNEGDFRNLSTDEKSPKTQIIKLENKTKVEKSKIAPSVDSFSQILPNGLVDNLEVVNKAPTTSIPNERQKKKDLPELFTAEIKKKLKKTSIIDLCCKYSYSDLLKLKINEKQSAIIHMPSTLHNGMNIKERMAGFPFERIQKLQDKLFVQPKLMGKRPFSAKSSYPLLSSTEFLNGKDLNLNTTSNTNMSTILQKRYKKTIGGKNNANKSDEMAIKCGDICSPVKEKLKRYTIPYEPTKCSVNTKKRIFLPSKMRLNPASCTGRPQFEDCIETVQPCPARADECLVLEPKKLPYIPAGTCPCIEPYVPSVSPKLKKLNLHSNDPPKPVCTKPSCQTPRMDDLYPPKYKPLKPYGASNCQCIDPPPLTDVKIKRLPRCTTEEVCRPVRICPEPEKCPQRADDCLEIRPKKLPHMPASSCPCIDPIQPKIVPKLVRLNLNIAEPKRICPQPPICDCSSRADDCLETSPRKLPKLTVGECPCEDKPLVDWNVKRLVCVDEPRDCIVPDPCLKFPRADWGCWEYSQDECIDVDEKCIEKKEECEPPKPYKHPCDKNDPCKHLRKVEARYNPSRKFSSTTKSKNLFLTVKTNNDKSRRITTANTSSKLNELSPTRQLKSWNGSSTYNTKDLIKLLDRSNCSTIIQNHNLSQRTKTEVFPINAITKPIVKYLNNQTIQTTSNSTKSSVFNIASRNITTSQSHGYNEQDMKKKKNITAKMQCKNIKPSLKSMCRKKPICPIMHACQKSSHRRNLKNPCEYDYPVCCQKSDAPFAAFSDVTDYKTKPFTKTSSFNCNHSRYEFYPNYNKEHDLFDASKKTDQKAFSTVTYVNTLPVNLRTSKNLKDHYRLISNNTNESMKATKSGKARLIKRHQKKIIVRKPISCLRAKPRQFSVINPPQIKCAIAPKCLATPRISCIRPQPNICKSKVAAPFPAFSDCLDEEMEANLSECPLDREKYLNIQPKFNNSLKEDRMIEPPLPRIGKIDPGIEEECIKDKFAERGIQNAGLTKSCQTFGDMQTLNKSKTIFIDKNIDCEKVKQKRVNLLKLVKNQSRNFCTNALVNNEFQLNYIIHSPTSTYTKKYHALVKNIKWFNLDKHECKYDNVLKINPYERSKQSEFNSVKERIKNIWTSGTSIIPTMLCTQMKCNYVTSKQGIKQLCREIGQNSKLRDYKMHPVLIGMLGNTELKLPFTTDGKLLRKLSKLYSHYVIPKFSINWQYIELLSERSANNQSTLYSSIGKPQIDHREHSDHSDPHDKKQKFPKLQPSHTITPQSSSSLKEFCDMDNVDESLGKEYYKIKHGLKNEGVTFDCSSTVFNKHSTDIMTPYCGNEMSHMKKIDNESVIEVRIRQHRTARDCSECNNDETKNEQAVDEKHQLKKVPSNNNDGVQSSIIEPLCIQNCFKNLPSYLPEEEKFRICTSTGIKDFQNEFNTHKEQQTYEIIKLARSSNEDVNKNIMHSEKCKKIYVPCGPAPEVTTRLTKNKCEKIPEPKINNPCKIAVSKTKNPSVSFILSLIRKILNYFKARPGCPEPHEWKIKALKQKAEKAANAIGMVVIDPKCLPPELLKTFKLKQKNCKVCSDKKTSDYRQYKHSGSFILQKRHYSNYVYYSNLDFINMILEENERKITERLNKDQQVNTEELSVTTEDLYVSDMDLKKKLDYAELFGQDQYSKSGENNYFGYPNILPDRENILEQAWRKCIDICIQNKQISSYGFFIEFVTQLESSLKTEDLEKLKTENVLRQLDKFLKNNGTKKSKK